MYLQLQGSDPSSDQPSLAVLISVLLKKLGMLSAKRRRPAAMSSCPDGADSGLGAAPAGKFAENIQTVSQAAIELLDARYENWAWAPKLSMWLK